MGQIYAMNSILDQDNDDYRSVKAAPINQIGGGYICLTWNGNTMYSKPSTSRVSG